MAKVSFDINGRKYNLGCDDGEEERLAGLGQKLDERIKILANQFGQIGDLRLLVMAGITMTDELEELSENLEEQAEKLNADMRRDSQRTLKLAQKSEISAADALEDAARRIERLAKRLGER
ncbi:MAG: cell division protein ZapA [Robiginitomaculum sp.]